LGLRKAFWRLSFAVHFAFVLLSSVAGAQPAVNVVLTNGPASNRFNIAILSEGYTTSQLGDFLGHATNAISTLLSRSPFSEYRSYFNALAISVPSNQSGSDHPGSGLYRDTYFNTTYDPLSDRVISFPTNAQGQGKVDSLIQTFLPECDLAVLLVNDAISGGSDGSERTAIASIGFLAGEYLVHEIGHVIAGLGDEYEASYPGFPATEEPNTTRETNRNAIKWKAWISPGTPVPTPETVDYANSVGLFEGAHYNSMGWFRPRLDCAMRSSFVPFCEVCRESLVLSFYERVRPLDAWVPTSLVLSWPGQGMVNFSVALQQPFSHALSVQWLTNSIEVTGATETNFFINPAALGNGARSVTARVRDNTPFVRNDPGSLLLQTVTWTELRLISPIATAGGSFAFRITGNLGRPVAIQASTDLINWSSLATNAYSPGNDWFTNSVAGNARRYYRAVTPPK
jgi:hypothetical protein